MTSEIILSNKQSEAFKYLEDDVTTELLYGGAAGGGKDYLACVWHIYRRITYPGTRGAICRYLRTSLMSSTYITFCDVLEQMGLKMGVDCSFNSRTNELTWSNGSSSKFWHLERKSSDPNYNNLGSFEFTDVIVNEAIECEQRAVDVLTSRIRYKIDETKGKLPKLLLLTNPSNGWIKDKYIKSQDGKEIVLKPYQKYIQATLHDNIDANFVKIYLNNLSKMSDYDKQRLIYGDWEAERIINGGIFYETDFIFVKPLDHHNGYKFAIMDLADSDTKEGDSSVIFVCRIIERKMFIEEVIKINQRIKQYVHTIKEVRQKVSGFYIESNGEIGRVLQDYLAEIDALENYTFFTTSQNKFKKIVDSRALIANNTYWFDNRSNRNAVTEICSYSQRSAHDDVADVMAMATLILKNYL